MFEPVIVGINKKLHRDPKPVKSSEGETADPNKEGDAKPEEKEVKSIDILYVANIIVLVYKNCHGCCGI